MNRQDDPIRFDELPPDKKQALTDWIRQNIVPARTVWKGKTHGGGYVTSYGLKHAYQSQTGNYVLNGAFKGAMLECGHQPVDSNEQNWRFRIRPVSKRSFHCDR